MKKSKGKILYGVIAIFGLSAAILPLTIYRSMETVSMKMDNAHMGNAHMGNAHMECFAACLAGTIIGAAIAVIAAASLFFKNIKLEVSSSAALFTGGFALIIVPRILGFCAHEDMACRYITAPTLAILGCAVIILSVVRLVSGVLAIRKASAAA